ncbi:rod shape-determining protein MreC [Priestia flexa]|uniref:rod shape-determining protein MreC n=1 Tax=Bacillaceae TaxID=186817 RepID=UPI00077C1E56|nr:MULTISPECIES: rod shape-determining protein MreC [Bacillaceae]KZB92781.1 rod shape-determining protein MreC [Bacillus sp. VT 712]MBN8432615.1 rod shape-determining protein MreC [Priestia flexa]MBY6085283.1 rod shape-determining protein MreC [Priestia flexa]MCA0965399.1 rod shape-determining protein MreC [Priestia flexa]MCM3064948.1 rod shape-determining protein MreC [Priestia flexa]
MPQFFLNKRLVILLVSIIVLVALIGFSLNGRKDVTWPEQFVKDTVGLVQATFHQPAQYVAGFFENVGDLKRTYEENEVLKARLDERMQLEAKVSELETENDKLREQMDKESDLKAYDPIEATVIARNPDRWHDVIAIDKGKVHNVEENMAVITPGGLIGKVKHASQFTSTVQLISSSDRTNRVSAKIQAEKPVYGLIEGYDEEEQALLLRRIPFDAEIKEKQKVVTSGLGGEDGVFPSGLVIGEITKIEPDEYGLTQKAYIKPSTDLYDLDHVMVAKRSTVMSEDSLEAEEEE